MNVFIESIGQIFCHIVEKDYFLELYQSNVNVVLNTIFSLLRDSLLIPL